VVSITATERGTEGRSGGGSSNSKNAVEMKGRLEAMKSEDSKRGKNT
jgi:hypothetical protein